MQDVIFETLPPTHTDKRENSAAIGIIEQTNATIRHGSHDPRKNTRRNPMAADKPDEDIITSRIEASLFDASTGRIIAIVQMEWNATNAIFLILFS